MHLNECGHIYIVRVINFNDFIWILKQSIENVPFIVSYQIDIAKYWVSMKYHFSWILSYQIWYYHLK